MASQAAAIGEEVAEMRIDLLLVERGLVRSRSQAKDLIARGKVLLDGRPVVKAGELVRDGAAIQVLADTHWVGRGAEKLDSPLRTFGISVAGRCAVDIGASTGGFTQVLLEHGAARVYAVDVGHDQLAESLRQDPRVVNMEGVNIRHPLELPEPVSLAVADLSFISLRLVFANIAALVHPEGDILLLVKPQFEAGPGAVNRQGVVTNAARQKRVVDALLAWFPSLGWQVQGQTASTLAGKSGNREVMVWLRRAVGTSLPA